MTVNERWRRLDAHAWVHRICILYTVLAALITVPALFAGFGLGAPWLVLVPLGLAILFGWLSHAWGEERRWSWVVLVALSGASAASGLLSLAVGSRSLLMTLHLVIDAALLVLLVHPDSRKVLDPPPAIEVGGPRDTTGAGW
jgi:hypothetical protein